MAYLTNIPTLSAGNRLGIAPGTGGRTRDEADEYFGTIDEVRRLMGLATRGRYAEYDRAMIANLSAAAAVADTVEVRETLLKQVKWHEESLAKREA